MFGPAGLSSFTKAVVDITSLIHTDSPQRDSLVEQAVVFFENNDADNEKVLLHSNAVKTAKANLQGAAKNKVKELTALLDQAEKKLKATYKSIKDHRVARFDRAWDVCEKIIRLSEGENWDETALNSAKVLGSILLLSPGDGNKLAKTHQRYKPLYKAVLCVRLLDKLILSGHITNKYITDHYDADTRFCGEKDDLSEFQREVVMPLMFAAIFQDVGMFHPQAQKMLRGENNTLDEFRLLEGEERKTLLKLNHTKTLEYITLGLGSRMYRGNSKEEKQAVDEKNKQTLIFTRTLINDAISPKQGLGNLIKAPQIYASVVLSTKSGYDIRDLPKAALLLEQVAKKGAVSEAAANSLVSIVGYFPQGFGVAYIPKDDQNQDLDRYEYAIVNGLNPEHPKEPRCRLVTRNLEFVVFGNNAQISVDSNLYFPKTQKKLQRVSEKRLKEILSKLYHDFEQRGQSDLIPKCWEPYDYFTFRNNQNLWNKKVSKKI